MFSRFLVSCAATLALVSSLSGCGTPNRQQVGIGTGAVLGGVAGHAVTGGSTLGTVGGAAVGGVVGNEVARPR